MSEPESIERSGLAWARRMDLVDTIAASRLSRLGVEQLADTMFAHVSGPWRELATAWTIWAFLADDELEAQAHEQATDARVREVMAFRGGSLGHALNDIVGSFATLSPVPHHRDQFWSGIVAYMEGCVWEARNRGSHTIPSTELYRRMRPDTGATRPFIRIALAATEMTRETEALPEVSELVGRAAWLPCLANDLVSFEKELAAGDFHNAVILLMKEKGLTSARAREALVEAYRLELAAFDDRLAKLAGSTLSALQAQAIRDVVHGADAWQIQSSRYAIR